MGDRGNIVVKQGDGAPDVWLYTHGRGYETPGVVREALALRERWEDAPYLTRIIFDKLTRREGGTRGFGITTVLTDENGKQRVTVDVEAQTVTLLKDGSTLTFEAFVECGPDTFDEVSAA